MLLTVDLTSLCAIGLMGESQTHEYGRWLKHTQPLCLHAIDPEDVVYSRFKA